MQGSYLRLYVRESDRHHGRLLWEWLLDQGNRLGVRGGSAFRSIGGFGRSHAVHEGGFFELAGTTSIEVEFVVTGDEAQRLFDLIRQAQVRVFYVCLPARFGVINPDAKDPPELSSED
jgi:PII-like signaling protein